MYKAMTFLFLDPKPKACLPVTGSSCLAHCMENETNTLRKTKQGMESPTDLSNAIWALIPSRLS